MENKLNATTLIIIIVTALFSAFFKSMFDKMFEKIKPDRKKIILTIKKTLIFLFAYIFPTLALINMYINAEKVDKAFVLFSVLLIFVIFLNLNKDLNN